MMGLIVYNVYLDVKFMSQLNRVPRLSKLVGDIPYYLDFLFDFVFYLGILAKVKQNLLH